MLFHTEGELSYHEDDDMEFKEDEMKNSILSDAVVLLDLPFETKATSTLGHFTVESQQEPYCSESPCIGISDTSKIKSLKNVCIFHKVVLRMKFNNFYKTFSTVAYKQRIF